MIISSTSLSKCYVIDPTIFRDKRGYFFESFNKKHFLERTGINVSFVQQNHSFSSYGVLRGLHLQLGPYEQAKLIKVIQGEILDIALDLRLDSSTFGKYFEVVLSSSNKKQLFIPKGFAHGFIVLSSEATVYYNCDEFYFPSHERTIDFNDPTLKIDWRLPFKNICISDKDKNSITVESLKREL